MSNSVQNNPEFKTYAYESGILRKGDFSNRMQCVGNTYAQTAKTLAADTVVITGAAAATLGAAKSTKFAKLILVPLDLIKQPIKKIFKGLNISKLKTKLPSCIVDSKTFKNVGANMKEAFKTIRSNPKAAAAVAIAVGTVGMLRLIHDKLNYKLGQIDQHGYDKAKIESKAAKQFD